MSAVDLEQIEADAIRGYRKINPRDVRDTEAHMSGLTFRALYFSLSQGEPPAGADGSTLFGMTVRLDDELAYGEVRYITENAHDRALRRLAADGKQINVMALEAFAPIVTPLTPEPTLRALLAKWCKKIRKG